MIDQRIILHNKALVEFDYLEGWEVKNMKERLQYKTSGYI